MRQTPEKMKALAAFLKGKMNLRSLVVTLAAIVVFTTTYLLVLPAFTLDKDEAAEQGGIDIVAEETAAMGAAEEAEQEEVADISQENQEEESADSKATDANDAIEDSKPEKAEDAKETQKPESAQKDDKSDIELLKTKKTLVADKATEDDYTISAVVDKNANVPADVFLAATELTKDTEGFDYDKYYKEALKALKKDSDDVNGIKTIKFYDISLESESREESVEPESAVNVKIAYDDGIKVNDAKDVRIVHFAEKNNGSLNPQVLDNKENKVDTVVDKKESKLTEASFETNGFSVFAIVGTETISTTFLSADGSTYEVTVSYGPEAGIPKDAKLEVDEITEDTIDREISYEEYIARTENALGMEEGTTEYIRLFDIKIVDVNDEKVVITAPVDVEIKLIDDDFDEMDENSTQVVHFEDGSETGECLEDLDIVEDGIVFQAEGFSVYSIVSSGATTDLNGNKFAIINTYNHTAVQGTNLAESNNRLSEIRIALSDDNKVRTLSDVAISKWKFTLVDNNNYYIQNEAGQYLNINREYVRVSNEPQSITVNTAYNRAGLVRLVANNYAVNDFNNGAIADGFGPWNDNGDNEWFRLYALDRIDDDSIRIHYVDETGNEIAPSKLISETTKAEGTSNYTETYRYGDVYDLYQPIEGYAYQSTHLNSYNGTQINAEVVLNTADSYNFNNNTPTVEDQLIQKASYRWEYQETNADVYPQHPKHQITEYDLKPFENGSHVYVVYKEGAETIPSHGGSGGGSDEKLDEPKPEKNVTPNGDGTYEMTLSVNASAKPISKSLGANVILVFDMSASMDSGIGNNQTRLSAARAAARNVATRLLALNDGRSEPLVEMMVIPFNSTTHNESGWYTTAGADNSQELEDFNGYINRGMGNTAAGTNWEAAIKRAKQVADAHQDGDDTYIIFLTDGNPWVGDNFGDMPHSHDATGLNFMQMGAYFYTTEPARQIVQSGYELYGVGMYGNVDVLHYLMNFAYTGRSTYAPTDNAYGHYYPAQQQELLIQALSDIAGTIEGNLAMAGVEFKDGIAISTSAKPDTTMTALKTETVDVNDVSVPILTGITYTKGKGSTEGSESFTVTVGTDGKAMFSINGGSPIQGSIVSKSYKKIKEDASGSENAIAYIYRLTTGGKTYEMPIATLSEAGDLDWDLSPLETLESGATYTLSTTIWPNQEAYDLVTDLNNGTAQWDESAQEEVEEDGHVVFYKGGASKDGTTYEHIVKYLNGTYAALSNTYQKLDYFIVETEGTEESYTKGKTIEMPYPDPMGLVDNTIQLEKKWEKNMMPGAEIPGKVTVDLLRGGKPFIPGIELKASEHWKTTKFIAPGMMISKNKADERGISGEVVNYNGGTGNYVILNTGYDYQFTEDYQRQFQLKEKIYHPMLVDNVLMNVIITTGDGIRTVTPTDDDLSQGLVAENVLKGGINLRKIVQDSTGTEITNSSEIFDVNVTLTAQKDEEGNLDPNVDKYYELDDEGNPVRVIDNSVAWYAYYKTTNGVERKLYDSDLIELGVLTQSGTDDEGYPVGDGINHPAAEIKNYGSGWFMIDFDDTSGVATGTVKVIPGYTLRFSNMAAGTTYSAAETAESAAGYEVSYAYNHQAYVDGEPSGEPVPDTGDTHVVVVNQGNNVTITNKQIKSDLIVIKTDDNGTPITSESDTAQFSLVRNTANDGSGTWVNAVDSGNDPQLINDGVITINSTNGVELKGLADGLYQLTERKAPDGYIILTGSVTFKLVGGNVTFVTITETVDPDDSSKKNYTVTDIEAPAGYTITAKSDDRPAQLAIANTPGQSLPNTGGPGTLLYTLSGIALMLGAALMYGFRMRRRERRSN